MAVKDFYSQWLGVTTEERPPNHYQLLRLEEFEADLERIREAAAGQMEKLRRFQRAGPTARETAERLLLEIQRAQYVLTDPQRKDEYDRWLRETHQKGAPKSVHLSLMAAQQELITKRDQAVKRRQWGQAEQLARKLVALAPEDPEHQRALEFTQAQAARARRSALVRSSAKTIVTVVVLLGLAVLGVSLFRGYRSGQEAETGAPTSETTGGEPAAQGRGEAARTPSRAARPDTADLLAQAEKLLAEGRYTEALAEYKRALRTARDRQALQERIQSLERKLAEIREQALERSRSAEARGDWSAAEQAYKELAALDGGKEVEAHLEALQSARRGEQLEKSGRFEEALTAYQEAVGGLGDPSEAQRRTARLQKVIEATRPQLRY